MKKILLLTFVILISFFMVSCEEEITYDYGFVQNALISSWKESLKGLKCNADAVFFGDSMTALGKWYEAFDEKVVVNLGIGGDTVSTLIARYDMISLVNPKKIFIMGGGNSLLGLNMSAEETAVEFRQLITLIKDSCPSSTIYIESLPPLVESDEKRKEYNKKIVPYNEELKKIADDTSSIFIDLYPLYNSGNIADLTMSDGVHFNENGYSIWYDAIRSYVLE